MTSWDRGSIAVAVDAVKNGMSVRKAADKYGVPKSTLSDRVTGKTDTDSMWGKKCQITFEDEKQLIDGATSRADNGVGFSKTSFLRYVVIFASQKGMPFKRDTPSEMWWRRLKARHPNFSLRSPEGTATTRHNAMTHERIGRYFNDLKGVYETYGLDKYPSRIWNMDETGVSMSQKPSKVLAVKGCKTVQGKAGLSRETITVIACGNAVGNSIPPHFIIAGKTTKKLHGFDMESCRDTTSPLYGSKFSVSDSGWTKNGIGRLWFEEHFIPNIGDARPQLLIFDGHGSHNNVEFIQIARDQNIILGELPSHTSNWTQPFDRSVFRSLKSNWNSFADDFIKQTGISIGHSSFLRVFGKAWQMSITTANISSGFRATGIYPFNAEAIPDIAFSPSGEATVQPETATSDAV